MRHLLPPSATVTHGDIGDQALRRRARIVLAHRAAAIINELIIVSMLSASMSVNNVEIFVFWGSNRLPVCRNNSSALRACRW